MLHSTSPPLDYYGDEYNDADYVQSNETEVGSSVTHHPIPLQEEMVRTPEFISSPKTVMVNEGDTIRLPCFVDEAAGLTLIWRRGSVILALGDRPYEATSRKVIVMMYCSLLCR